MRWVAGFMMQYLLAAGYAEAASPIPQLRLIRPAQTAGGSREERLGLHPVVRGGKTSLRRKNILSSIERAAVEETVRYELKVPENQVDSGLFGELLTAAKYHQRPAGILLKRPGVGELA